MSIPIRFTTVVLKKSFVEERYPGGLAAFLHAYPGVTHDEHLLGASFMSSQYVEELKNLFFYIGARSDEGLAVCDMGSGPWENCPGIDFVEDTRETLLRRWSAVCSDVDRQSG